MNRPNRRTRRRMNTNTMSFKSKQKEKKKKTLTQMSDEELQTMINQMEYNRIKLPKSSNPRIIGIWEEYTRRIMVVRDLLNSRKGMEKKDDN